MSSSSDQSYSPHKAHLNVKTAFRLLPNFSINRRPNIDAITRGTTKSWVFSPGIIDELGLRTCISSDLTAASSVMPYLNMVRGPTYSSQSDVVKAIERELSFPAVRLALMPLLGNPVKDPVEVLVEYVNNISNDLVNLKEEFQKYVRDHDHVSGSQGSTDIIGIPPFVFPSDPEVLISGDCSPSSSSYKTKIQVEDMKGVLRVFELTLLTGFEGLLRPSNFLYVRFRDLGRSGCEILFSVRTYDGRISWSNSVIGGPCSQLPSIKEILSLYNTLCSSPSRGCALS